MLSFSFLFELLVLFDVSLFFSLAVHVVFVLLELVEDGLVLVLNCQEIGFSFVVVEYVFAAEVSSPGFLTQRRLFVVVILSLNSHTLL